MWNAEAGSLMNLRRNRAPATSPASCISQASQSRPRFPAISLANHTYATYCINEACQSASHPNTKRCRHSPQLIYSIHCSFGALHRLLIHRQTLVQTHACISSNTSRTRPTLINRNTKTNTHTSIPVLNSGHETENSLVSQSDLQASRQQTCTSPLDLPCWLHALPSACKLCQ